SNPWVFRQMSEFFRTNTYVEPAEADRHQMIRTYFRMLVEEEIPGAIGKMKQFASWFTHGVRNGSELRRQVQSAQNVQEVLGRVDEIFGGLFMAASGSSSTPACHASSGRPTLRRGAAFWNRKANKGFTRHSRSR